MKKLLAIVMFTISASIFVACSNEKKTDPAYDDFKTYVSSHRDSVQTYYDNNWDDLQANYDEKKNKAEAKMEDWNDNMKAEYASLQADWDSFKEDYQAEMKRKDDLKKTEEVMMNILPAGISEDMTNVNAANILDVHTHFVTYIEDHKQTMTREQWDKIELLWEALGTRKNQLEKEIKTSDNLKIAEQKIKFGAIKATNRPSAKMDENSEAKK